MWYTVLEIVPEMLAVLDYELCKSSVTDPFLHSCGEEREGVV